MTLLDRKWIPEAKSSSRKSMDILLFVVGLVFLIVGAEALVRGASRLAIGYGISPLIVGLTVVALGTSSPEIAISLNAALSGQASLVMGNVIGSNIFNVLAILGMSAMVAPLIVQFQMVRLEVPLMIAVSILVLFFSLNGRLNRLEGILLLAGLIAYVVYSIFKSRQVKEAQAEAGEESETAESNILLNLGMMVVGLALLIFGSRWLVNSAISFAQYLGISELIIGLTIVSAGTSLPEVVTSIIAVMRGERDIAVGNVVGSNLFNLMCVLGIATIASPTGIEVTPAIIGFDIPIMIAVAVACLPIFFTGGIISRWEGSVLLGYYVAYTLYLILAATEHDALPRFNTVMLYFVIPLTVITLLVIVVQESRRRAERSTV